MSGARRWARWRSTGTRARYRPAKMALVGRGGQRRPLARARGTDHDVIVIGGGHNGLVTAAYLARAGLRTLVLEARSIVGGTAASRDVRRGAGEHLQLRPHDDPHDAGDRRARPRRARPALRRHGSVGRRRWRGRAVRRGSTTTTSGARSTSWRRRIPTRSTDTAATCAAARPAVELILRAATEPPSAVG